MNYELNIHQIKPIKDDLQGRRVIQFWVSVLDGRGEPFMEVGGLRMNQSRELLLTRFNRGYPIVRLRDDVFESLEAALRENKEVNALLGPLVEEDITDKITPTKVDIKVRSGEENE